MSTSNIAGVSGRQSLGSRRFVMGALYYDVRRKSCGDGLQAVVLLTAEHRQGARLERREPLLEDARRRVERRGVSFAGDMERLANRNRGGRERARNLRAIPAAERPVPIGFDVKRQHRITRR